MNQVLILQHDELYPAQRLVTLLRDFGIPCDVRRLFAGDAVPHDLDEIRMAFLLGGSMRVGELDVARHPWHADETALARTFVEQDRAIVGVGFGAEILSLAAGAKVAENRKPSPAPDQPGDPAPEFGWASINFPFPGGTEPAVFGMVDGTGFFTWHRDTFQLPALPPPANPPPPPARPPTGNVLMASSRACRHQAYRFKNRVFGFQFHFELDGASIERIIDARSKLDGIDAAPIRAESGKHLARYERAGAKLVQNLVQFMKVY
jgi:GMP synthase-like glutamine amidotransferase